jgi:hypothetical protein
MPLVDTTDPAVYHDNYYSDARKLYYNHVLGVPTPNVPRLRIHYCWYTEQFKVRNRAVALTQDWSLHLQDGQKIIILGGGFGWLQEELEKLITADIVTLDTGQWVHSVKDTDESVEYDTWMDTAGITDPTDRADWKGRMVRPGGRAKVTIHDEDLGTGASRGRIKQALNLQGNQKADYLITEQVLPWLDDSECGVVSNVSHSIATNVAHILTPFALSQRAEPPPLWNWKHLDDLSPTRPDLEALPWYTTTSWKALLPDDLFVSVHNYRVT